MIQVREAVEADVEAIADIFTRTYSDHYAHPEFCDPENLKRIIFADDVLILVAELEDSRRVIGTASIILDIGAFGDLIGEFGRLVVHPDGRRQGIGHRLMEARLERVRERLHMAIVENRAVHSYSQSISAKHGFVPVGFLPSKLKFEERENIALYAKPFGACLELRKNHPRIIPEAYSLADCALGGFGLPDDAILDDETPAYSASVDFELEAMTSAGYASLLRFERGRVRNREILGPMKLHAGVFQIRVSHYRYLLAKRDGRVVGGVGFHIDENEKAARILELVCADDDPVRCLLMEAIRVCREEEGAEYLEVDVNAHSPAMQRTLLELGFLPCAYVPAMSFHRVERLDVIRMAKLFVPLDVAGVELHETSRAIAERVIRAFEHRQVAPRLVAAIPSVALFDDLSDEQVGRLAAVFRLVELAEGETLSEGVGGEHETLMVISGRVEVRDGGSETESRVLGSGETAGELALVGRQTRPIEAVATTPAEVATVDAAAAADLFRQRPDIGMVVFRNLAKR